MNMKKLFFILVAVLAVPSTVISCSCGNNETPWGVEYALNSNGKTDASVSFAFFNGTCTLNGDADYVFDWSNTQKLMVTESVPLGASLMSPDPNTLQAANYVNGWLDEWFKVVSFEGHYDIYIKGYIKETKTQITFEIDRHFTNIEE